MHARQLNIIEDLIEKALVSVMPTSGLANGHLMRNGNHVNLIGIDPIRLGRREVIALVDDSLVFMESDLDGIGHITKIPGTSARPKAYKEESTYVLENGHFRVIISNGRITSLLDVPEHQELIVAGPRTSNGGLMIYDDFPRPTMHGMLRSII